MKITRLETIPVNVPINPRRAIRGAAGAHLTSPFLLIRVHTDEGLEGLGEVSCTPLWSGEDQVTAAHLIKSYIVPQLEGQDPTDIERLSRVIQRSVAANPFTKSGVEIALWDLAGKALAAPVYRLLGGKVREFVPTKWAVGAFSSEQAAANAQEAVALGFTSMKVKVGTNPEADVARVRAVREAVGPNVRVGIDANGGWSVRTAVWAIRRIEEFGIFFAEQPVPPLDVAWMADVRRRVNVPVMADESLYTLQDAMALARADAADILSVYIGKGGGIGPARKVAAVAEAAGLVCTIGSNLEMGVANAAMIHLGISTAAIAAEEFPCDIAGTFFYEDTILAEPLLIEAGRAAPLEHPGLGVRLDDNKVRRYTADV